MAAEALETTLTEILSVSTKVDNPKVQEYVQHLTTLPLDGLLAEPTSLTTQAHHLTSSLTSLTHTSYPTFLALHRTTASLSSSLGALSSALDSLISDSLPTLDECAGAWRTRTDAVLTERRRARVVLEQHDKLRDLLDIPLLIDTCVRNGHFAEALALAGHARALGTLQPQPPRIVISVLAEVDQSVTQMLVSLLATLHEPHRKLPALWKAVSFLRRMAVFGGSGETEDEVVEAEQQIALAFLSGREACLKASLDSCARDVQGILRGVQDIGSTDGERELAEREAEDLARYLKKYIDVWREGVYDILTQYTTIFLERAPTSGALTSVTSPIHSKTHRLSNAGAPPSSSLPHLHTALHRLLTTHTTHALSTHLLPILHTALPALGPTSLPALLTQLTYCASAFSRAGADFRGLLEEPFVRAVTAGVRREVNAATRAWESRFAVKYQDETTILSPRLRHTGPPAPSLWLIAASAASNPPTGANAEQTPVHTPPPVLVSYPPLALLTNAILSALNGLRLLAPTRALPKLLATLDAALARCGSSLLTYAQSVSGKEKRGEGGDAGAGIETQVVRACGEVYVRVFVPFVRRALVEGVYAAKLEEVDEAEAEEGARVKDMVREWESWLETQFSWK
ncbi:hypothetical protein HGRIS_008626 [Hohenbuehelia grisea]|uniref:Conserved oligomeric Golgi complex subunit 8 n=1 Tax=Hohenbuehelia grisea TaxID=104357 RepID=A0ABR3J8J2_9AGAR